MTKDTMLSQKKCIPAAVGTPAMSLPEARVLLRQVPGWELALDNRAIRRRIVFKDFMSALSFVNQLGAIAESENHHPDVMLGWGYAEVVLWTHNVSGLHENDFIMASKINLLQPGI
jgi:4a-hydroxytetrahydrobiopterin dehydratase